MFGPDGENVNILFNQEFGEEGDFFSMHFQNDIFRRLQVPAPLRLLQNRFCCFVIGGINCHQGISGI